MYSRIALTQQGPFRQLQEKRQLRKEKKQQKHRDFETNNKNLEIELCLPGRSWKLLAKKMMIKKIAPKKERFDAQKRGWFGSLPATFPPIPSAHPMRHKASQRQCWNWNPVGWIEPFKCHNVSWFYKKASFKGDTKKT